MMVGMEATETGIKARVPASVVAQVLAAGAGSRVQVGHLRQSGLALILPAPTIPEQVALTLRGWEYSRPAGAVFYRLRSVS